MFEKYVGLVVSFLTSVAWVAMMIAVGAMITIAVGSAQAQAQAAGSDQTEIWSTVPGTRSPGSLEAIIKGDTIYPAIPGTRTPNYGSSNRHIIRGGKVYRAIPGTNTPDYSRSYRIR